MGGGAGDKIGEGDSVAACAARATRATLTTLCARPSGRSGNHAGFGQRLPHVQSDINRSACTARPPKAANAADPADAAGVARSRYYLGKQARRLHRRDSISTCAAGAAKTALPAFATDAAC
ncbi:MAG TPA: hypothetical protein DHV56_06310 [Rhodobacter sp.]|nr:hypothetical protein [Rhodobacter sp.]